MATEPRIPNDIRDLDYQDITGFVTRDDPTSHPTDTGGYADVFIGSYNKGDGERMKVRCFYNSGCFGAKLLKVAIKVFRIPLRNEKVEQYLIRETAVWSRLHHPNILRFLGLADDLGRHGVPALISPWCNNGTVMEYLKDRPLDDRFRLILGIADGVQYLHDDDVIHGNLKPSNILISHEGLPLLGGFSRSHLLNYRGFTTRPNGTCRYQAPELFEEEARYTKASDVYAFGMTCSEIWTGLPPFAGYTQDASIILQVWKGARPACSSPCSEETSLLWKLLERCWMKEPEERWPIGIVRHELGKLVETFRELEKVGRLPIFGVL
ncbi:Serine/threonine-protein kinase HT1 [Leucoagaricus sp. SymC.cos]|nr:Serine/threonine-protein kinase HT1 [Leucoagaricus sp. SymC.cos]